MFKNCDISQDHISRWTLDAYLRNHGKQEIKKIMCDCTPPPSVYRRDSVLSSWNDLSRLLCVRHCYSQRKRKG